MMVQKTVTTYRESSKPGVVVGEQYVKTKNFLGQDEYPVFSGQGVISYGSKVSLDNQAVLMNPGKHWIVSDEVGVMKDRSTIEMSGCNTTYTMRRISDRYMDDVQQIRAFLDR